MPFWRIFHCPETFNAEQKAALAESITKLYVEVVGLPAFYADVAFIALPADSFFAGGKPGANFVRIAIEQIARQFKTNEEKVWWLAKIDETLAPHIKDRGLDWEYHISETPRELWKVNGLVPPPSLSDAEKKWLHENKATPY